MTTFAELGVQVDSGSAIEGARNLQALARSAKAAETATISLARAALVQANAELAAARASGNASAAQIQELKTKQAQARAAYEAARATAAKAQADRAGANAAIQAAAAQERLETSYRRQSEQAARAARAAQDSANAANRMRVAMAAYDTTTRRGMANRINLINQLNDIGVSLASGQAAWLVAIQQGSQLSTIQGGLAGAFRETAKMAAMAALSYAPLLAALAAIALVIKVMSNEITLANGKTASFTQTAIASFQVLGDLIAAEVKPAIESISPLWEYTWDIIVKATKGTFNIIVGIVATLAEYVKQGAMALYEVFQSAYDSILVVWNNFPKAFADIIISALNFGIQKIGEFINSAIERIDGFIEKYNKTLGSVLGTLDKIGKIDFDQFKIGNPFEGTAGDTATAVLNEWKRAFNAMKESYKELGRIGKENMTKDWFAAFEDLVRKKVLENAAKEAAKLTKEQQRQKEAIDNLIRSQDAENAQLAYEIKNVGEAGAAYEAARKEMELLAQAQQGGRKLSESQRQAIKDLAQEFGELTQKLKEAKMANDLVFERSQINRTPVEQEVAQAMRELYGNDYEQYMDSAIADTIRMNTKLEEQRDKVVELSDTIRETLGGALYEAFTGGIRSAEDFFDFVAKAFAQLAQQNLDSLIQKMFGKSGTPFSFNFSGGAPSSSPVAGRGEWVSFAKIIGLEVGGQVSKVMTKATASQLGGVGMSTGAYTSAINVGKGLGDGLAPTLNKGFDRQYEQFAAAIRKIESGSYAGNYNAQGKVITNPKSQYYGDRAYGAYQVMGKNIAEWTRLATGQAATLKEFLGNKSLQDKVMYDQYSRNMKKYGDTMDAVAVHFTGKPASAVRGKSGINDGYNTADSYMANYQNALKGLPANVEFGAKEGTMAGAELGIGSALDPGTGSATSPQQAQNGLGQNLMGGLSAGLGGFSMGYQSGNAGMGALGGFMQGLGTPLGIWGGVIGGIAGLLGGIFGAQNQVKQAKRQLEKQMAQINVLLAVGEGTGVGTIQKKITDYTSETDKAVPLAWKAEDMKLVERLHQAVNSMIRREATDFYNALPGMLEGYRSGYGRQGAEQQGAEAVFSLREELRAMIADVRYFGQQRIDATTNPVNKQWWLENYGQERWEQELAGAQANAEKTLADAYEAAREMALSFITGTDELTETQQAIKSLRGAAETLVPTLIELGMTAEDAAAAIDGKVIEAMKKLKEEFEDNLTAMTNDASGKGYFNEVKDLIEQYKDMQADAASLGVSQTQVDEWFRASAQAIVDGSQLIGVSFDELIAKFPELGGIVRQFVDGIADAGTRMQEYEDRLFNATNDTSTLTGALAAHERQAQKDREREMASGGENIVMLERVLAAERLQIMEDFAERARQRALQYENRYFAATNDTSTLTGQLAAFDRAAAQERIEEIKAGGEAIKQLDKALAAERAKIIRDHNNQIIEEQKRALEEAQDFLKTWFNSLKEYIDDLKAGPDSPLSPEARLAEAQQQFAEQYAKALTGDRDAANSLINYSGNVLDAARDRFASSDDFQAIWNDIIAKLEAIPDQVSAEQFIVNEITEALATQTETLVDTTTTMNEMLLAAFRAGPRDTAAALALYFEELDTTVDGLLTFEELKNALQGKATDAAIRDMMAEMDLDGDLQVSKLEALLAAQGLTKTAIVQAVADSPGATAGLLSSYFNRLDTSVNGLLDFGEMKAALGGIATDAQIKQMMQTLDANGDGQLSQLELIKGATNQTANSLGGTDGVIKQLMDLRAITQEKLTGTNNLLIALTDRVMAVLNNSNVRAGGPGGFKSGGYTGSGSVDSIAGYVHAQEYVNNAETVRRLGVGFFDALNRGETPVIPVAGRAGADQAELAELRGLRAEVRLLRSELRTNNDLTAEGNERIGNATEQTASNTRAERLNTRMSTERPATPGSRRRS